VTAISSDDLAQSGKVRVEDIINQLPQAFAAQGSAISNASDGTASVDLRGLGTARTLVLVNGRRLMPGDPDGGNAADLNFIPSALVRRVEVLTGGASSVYGADAVAGVVNFIMDDQFEGVKAEVNFGYNTHHNDNAIGDVVDAAGFPTPDSDVDTGYSRDYTFAIGMGAPEDKGHAVFYATYRSVASVSQADYDFSACTLGSGEPFTPITDTSAGCAGSSTTSPPRFNVVDPATGGLAGDTTFDANGNLRPFDFGTDLYNFGPLNYYQRPDERYTAGVFADYQVAESADVYGEFMWMDDRSVSQIAPSGAFFGQTFALSCSNPLWSASEFQEWCGQFGLTEDDTTVLLPGKRNVEGGGRQNDIGHEASRLVAGVRGNINDIWSYDVSGVHGETKRNSTYLNDFSVSRLGKALNAVDDGTGNTVCAVNADADTTNDDLACVPYNIWQPNGVTPEALAYLQIPLMIRAQAIENIMNGNVTADLSDKIQLPTADAGLQVNFGAEYRHEETEFQPDLSFQLGDGAGQGAATLPVAGQFHVQEFFTEVALPLVDGKKGVDQLAFEGGYRFSDYSTGFDTDTYKFGLSYKPVDALRLRGSFQHAVRAPNVGELFSLQQVALDGTTDPCAGAAVNGLVNGHTEAECARTGVTAAQFGNVLTNPANQYNGLIGGNPQLQPEEADTTSFGFVFQPNFVDGLTVAVDYFDIQIDDTIGGVGADLAINSCVQTGDPFFCDLIHRDQFGSLWLDKNNAFIVDTNLNTGSLSTKGFDLQAGYGFDIGNAGRLGFNLIGTWLDELVTQPLPGADSYDCKGLYGATCLSPSPEWRHSFRTDWSAPWQNLDIGVTWRYYDGVDVDTTSAEVMGGAENTFADPSDAHLGSRSYIDLTAAMTFADHYTVRVGANNLMDKDPPINGSSACPTGPCNGNTWPQVYDTLGRQLFLTFTSNF
jgi:outer membrane receptor protein involved in Fe transport